MRAAHLGKLIQDRGSLGVRQTFDLELAYESAQQAWTIRRVAD
jgi:hypothetical protein